MSRSAKKKHNTLEIEKVFNGAMSLLDLCIGHGVTKITRADIRAILDGKSSYSSEKYYIKHKLGTPLDTIPEVSEPVDVLGEES